MDEKLVIFEDDRIFYLTGSGPNATGQQNNFSDPQLVTSDVGCSNTRSIVQTPKGLMFMSNKGIYLLDRGLSTHYIGAPVEAYNSLTITSAILIQDENQVRFTASDGGSVEHVHQSPGQWCSRVAGGWFLCLSKNHRRLVLPADSKF